MASIECYHCKQKTDECPECHEPFEQRLMLPVVLFIIALLLSGITGYRWYSAMEEHEKAMALRQTYLKKNPEALKKLR
ncbi:MAG: hypothetical protein CVV42_17915 [Candidatus Riflebacteria bacterium HGW-Riflebacteria-2]|jgi:hypothetical protein|nr:MAG: hypothetical protein CVV42_17915 [Candidatus Riflebacteria bacterium HGW-Riflebacteria-2]